MGKTTQQHTHYWQNRKIDWEKAYGAQNWNHPHRLLLASALNNIGWISLFELGCGAGANLATIIKLIKNRPVQLGGIDINKEAIEVARRDFNNGIFKVADSKNIPLSDKAVDVVLSDMHLIYKKWPNTEGRNSTTFASLVTDEDSYLVGEYPEGWKADSIRMLTVGGKKVDKKEFYTFRKFLEDNSGDTSRIFSDFARRYYINPHIDVSGTITAWGQYTPANIDDGDANDATETVFIGEEEGNQAIIEEALSYLFRRDGKLQESATHHNQAQAHLEQLWGRISDEQFGYQSPKNDGIFQRFDVLQGTLSDELFKRDQFL